jgi:hypothetical protein
MSLQRITEEEETTDQLGFDIVDAHDPSEVCYAHRSSYGMDY